MWEEWKEKKRQRRLGACSCYIYLHLSLRVDVCICFSQPLFLMCMGISFFGGSSYYITNFVRDISTVQDELYWLRASKVFEGGFCNNILATLCVSSLYAVHPSDTPPSVAKSSSPTGSSFVEVFEFDEFETLWSLFWPSSGGGRLPFAFLFSSASRWLT